MAARRNTMTGLLIVAVLACGTLLAACDSASSGSSSSDGSSSTERPAPGSSVTAPPRTTVRGPLGSASVSLPPAAIDARGDAAVWTMGEAGDVQSTASSVTALVARLGCAGGVTGDVFEPVVEIRPADIVVTFSVAPLDRDLEQTCPGNDAVRWVP